MSRGSVSDVRWDRDEQLLSGWFVLESRRIRIKAPRALIHTISIYNDAVEWEIERYKEDILERLMPILLERHEIRSA